VPEAVAEVIREPEAAIDVAPVATAEVAAQEVVSQNEEAADTIIIRRNNPYQSIFFRHNPYDATHIPALQGQSTAPAPI
jgi:hypothetical protein